MDPRKPEVSTNPPQDAEQPEKPLGRGLEQISHLFLTQKPNVRGVADLPSSSTPGSRFSQTPPAPAPQTALLPLSTTIGKDRLVSLLRHSPGALAEELRVIDIFVSCHPHSDIDLLALDRSNQLTVIDIETSFNDAILLRGLSHCDWLQNNIRNIRRMYPGETIVLPSRSPLFLVAPRFSSMAMSAARQLTQSQIHWVRYQAFDVGGSTGISFEPMPP
jgi:hypothetical protein